MSLWYNNNIWPRKEPGRIFNLSIECAVMAAAMMVREPGIF